jgi:hypothetical protein
MIKACLKTRDMILERDWTEFGEVYPVEPKVGKARAGGTCYLEILSHLLYDLCWKNGDS